MATDPDFPALLASITRCNAVYEPDQDRAFAAFELLGSRVLGRYCDTRHQAVAHIAADGVATLTISGSRVSEGSTSDTLGDLFEDVDFTPLAVADGVEVATGAHDGLGAVFTWALGLFGDTALIRVEGHSLGGQRTHLAPLWVTVERLHSMIAWAPPKAANDAFYAAYPGHFAKCTTPLHDRDPWAAWPWVSETLEHPPGALLWLRQDGWEVVTRDQWPGGDILHASDHDPAGYLAAVRALVAA